jgi:hypothetical protein
LQHPAYIGELAAWLNQFGLASEAFTWLHGLPPQLAGQGLIPLALADSYVALRQWKKLETYLQGGHWIGQDHIRIALLALAIRNQSGNQDSAFAWDRAIRLASDSPTALDKLARNSFTMLSLLSGKELPAAHKYAAELYAGEPGNPVFASSYD